MKNTFHSIFAKKFFFAIFFLLQTESLQKVQAINFEKGKDLFFTNCTACHMGGKNIIIPEKNLKKDSLETNGMNNVSAITYQIINGKNGMPAFGGRLTEEEIEELANYVLIESTKN